MYKIDDPLLNEFLDNSCEQLFEVERDLLAIEEKGSPIDQAKLNKCLRSVRTIRGGAGLFDLAKVSQLAYETESVLALIISLQLMPEPTWITVLLQAIDRLSEMLTNLALMEDVNISPALNELSRLCAGGNPTRPASQPRPSVHRSRPEGEPLRVLLAEDDFACRLLLQTFLSRYGECHIAVNGKEAVQAFSDALNREQRYHLVCMDIMMPEMDGNEAVRKIREIEEDKGIRSTAGARIFMTTALSDIRDVFRSFKELCDAYLVKPIDLNQLTKNMKFYDLIRD